MTFPRTRAYNSAIYKLGEALAELSVDLSSQGDEVIKDLERLMSEWRAEDLRNSEAGMEALAALKAFHGES